jgi:hypothetical protein
MAAEVIAGTSRLRLISLYRPALGANTGDPKVSRLLKSICEHQMPTGYELEISKHCPIRNQLLRCNFLG